MSNQLSAIGAYLREHREARGLSATQVAAALDTSESAIRRIENGRGETRAGLLMRYGALVGASGDELMRLYTQEKVPA
jgi:transcriptional regulator with XRE-family HTH domain